MSCRNGCTAFSIQNLKFKYSSQTIFIKYILTHAEYDKEK
ncbi:type II toxin-antitoxin system HigB family toxin [Scytonema sp. NUACC26]